MFSNILVPIDFSDPSRGALRLAIKLVGKGGGRVTLLHVGPESGLYSDGAEVMLSNYEALATQNRHAAESIAREEVPEHVSWRVIVHDGFPPEVIVKEAADGYDLLVMGTHGRTGIGRVLLGSVTERVLHAATIPVLVTR